MAESTLLTVMPGSPRPVGTPFGDTENKFEQEKGGAAWILSPFPLLCGGCGSNGGRAQLLVCGHLFNVLGWGLRSQGSGDSSAI